MKKPKKGQCHIEANVEVTTTYDTGEVRHNKFERDIETVLNNAFLAHIKGLCDNLVDSAGFKWKRVNKKTVELIRRRKS